MLITYVGKYRQYGRYAVLNGDSSLIGGKIVKSKRGNWSHTTNTIETILAQAVPAAFLLRKRQMCLHENLPVT